MGEAAIVVPGTVRHPPPLSVYVHLPWCTRKCPYCDFNSHKAAAVIPEAEYVRALLADAETVLPLVWGRRPQSLFIGGGTPSLFSPEALDTLLCGLRALSLLPPNAEVTLEANPGSSETAKFAEFAALGVNRLSLGAQSFNDQALVALGRIHNGREARQAAQAAAEVFDNFNIDLMHALPQQDTAAARDDVTVALEYDPPHLSLYQLTLEPGTPFFRRPPLLPPPDESAAIGDAVVAAAMSAGLARYEISAFARPERQCLHNINYWQFGDYVGIGAGAHGKITAGGKIYRQARVKHPLDYMRRATAGNAVSEERTVAGKDAVFEFMLNALRLTEGFAPELLMERAGVALTAVDKILCACEDEGLLLRNLNVIKPSERGLRYLNDMLLRFLPETDAPPTADCSLSSLRQP